jgi:hypothetical protein
MVETRSGRAHTLVVESVATIEFDKDTESWLAEVDGEFRSCGSPHAAVEFVETLWEPETEVKVLHSQRET